MNTSIHSRNVADAYHAQQHNNVNYCVIAYTLNKELRAVEVGGEEYYRALGHAHEKVNYSCGMINIKKFERLYKHLMTALTIADVEEAFNDY